MFQDLHLALYSSIRPDKAQETIWGGRYLIQVNHMQNKFPVHCSFFLAFVYLSGLNYYRGKCSFFENQAVISECKDRKKP